MTAGANLIDVKGLKVSFSIPGGGLAALRGISFRIRPGSIVAIVGESGSGKSVTAQAIMGILPKLAAIEDGEILFRDPVTGSVTDLAKLDPRSPTYRGIRGRRISMIFQEPMVSLSPLHKVGAQIGEAIEVHEGLTGNVVRKRVLDMMRLVRFPDPERAYKSYPFELSGGLRQRAMIAMALVCRPALLIADEPTTALDVTVQAQILGLIKDIQRELGMAVMMITHDMGVVANVAEEIVVLYRGEVMEAGTARDIFRDPRHPYLRALMAAVPRINLGRGERLKPLVPEGAEAIRPQRPLEPAAEPLIEVRNLTKSFDIRSDSWKLVHAPSRKVTAVNNVSFAVRRGECLGLVGESGCGKTTVSKLIMGAFPPDSGKILLHDGGTTTDIAGLSDTMLAPYRRTIQYVFQDPFSAFNPRMTVLEIVSEPLKVQGIGDAASRRKRVQELLARVGIDPRFLNRYPHSFSGGQRQRIGVARALALSPKMLILDEPVSALDVSTQAQVLNLLNDLRADLGLTYIFISHNLAVVNYVADRVAVMCRGRLVEVAPREKLFTDPRHPYTKALLASAPEPDIDRPLNFAAIRDGRMTEPQNWPAPFDEREGSLPDLIDIGGGHLVRARAIGSPVLTERIAAQ
ncbi:MAG TPA: ABC transporter ATP-binding protein [Hyphomicrobiaceae bacterium]|nr:ABC transporter ATP-binding protein [Hyphomicrobiaceae bacterium]